MLKKLSLAALVAMGSMSVASANTDLTEAIKGVTIGGYLRYRYTEKNVKTDGSDNHVNSTTNEYKAVLNTNIKASDTVTVHGRFVYLNSFTSNNTSDGVRANPFNVQEAYLQYSKDGLAVKAGRQALATPLTDHDDDYAQGVLGTYTINGVTLAGAYFTEVANSGVNANNKLQTSQNVEVLAAIANVGPAKVQAWFYNMENSNGNTQADGKDGEKAYFLEAAGSIDMVTLKAQYASAKGNYDDAKRQKFFALAAVTNVANVNATAAYLKFGKDGSDVAVGTNNADGLIAAGDILTDTIQQNSGLADGWGGALVLKTTVGKFTPGVQYVHATLNKSTDKTKINEYDFDLAYAYNKKLNFSGYYAILKNDNGSKADSTRNQFRFEAKYSF